MATNTATANERRTGGEDLPAVDPRAPRFGQAITATVLAAGIGFQAPMLVYAVAAILLASALTGWRVDLYGFLWRRVVLRFVEPMAPEPAAPHRFAKLVGAVGTGLATILLLGGVVLPGYLLAGAVAVAAGLAASTGFCLGCRMYRTVGLFRRLDVV